MTTPYRVLIAKPGLDGHDRGAKFIARALRDEGFEVIYTGIRRTAAEIAATAIREDVDVVGLSSLSGAHLRLFPEVIKELVVRCGGDIPVLGGGVISDKDKEQLLAAGLCAIFTPGTPAATIIESFSDACNQQ